jgi:hypothetical protein
VTVDPVVPGSSGGGGPLGSSGLAASEGTAAGEGVDGGCGCGRGEDSSILSVWRTSGVGETYWVAVEHTVLSVVVELKTHCPGRPGSGRDAVRYGGRERASPGYRRKKDFSAPWLMVVIPDPLCRIIDYSCQFELLGE